MVAPSSFSSGASRRWIDSPVTPVPPPACGAGADQHYRAGATIAERLANTDPTNTEYQRTLEYIPLGRPRHGRVSRGNPFHQRPRLVPDYLVIDLHGVELQK